MVQKPSGGTEEVETTPPSKKPSAFSAGKRGKTPALNSYFCHIAKLSMLHSQVLAVASYFVPRSLPNATVNACLT